MNRRQFTRTCLSCMAAASLIPVMDGCAPTHYVTGTLEGEGLSVLKSEFSQTDKGQTILRDHIIVANDKMKFPIYVYRFSENEYSALLMKCTHQGNELQASGDHLHCTAHGSEFSNRGEVKQGPAEQNLRAFSVSSSEDKILIVLK